MELVKRDLNLFITEEEKEKKEEEKKEKEEQNKLWNKFNVLCKCGCFICLDGLSRHKNTIKHQDIMQIRDLVPNISKYLTKSEFVGALFKKILNYIPFCFLKISKIQTNTMTFRKKKKYIYIPSSHI